MSNTQPWVECDKCGGLSKNLTDTQMGQDLKNILEEEDTQSWEEEFEKLKIFSAPVPNGGMDIHTFVVDIQEVHGFITTLLEKTKQETVKEVKKCLPERESEAWGMEGSLIREKAMAFNDCRNQFLTNLNKII